MALLRTLAFVLEGGAEVLIARPGLAVPTADTDEDAVDDEKGEAKKATFDDHKCLLVVE